LATIAVDQVAAGLMESKSESFRSRLALLNPDSLLPIFRHPIKGFGGEGLD